jgi:hypothetical protein
MPTIAELLEQSRILHARSQAAVDPYLKAWLGTRALALALRAEIEGAKKEAEKRERAGAPA